MIKYEHVLVSTRSSCEERCASEGRGMARLSRVARKSLSVGPSRIREYWSLNQTTVFIYFIHICYAAGISLGQSCQQLQVLKEESPPQASLSRKPLRQGPRMMSHVQSMLEICQCVKVENFFWQQRIEGRISAPMLRYLTVSDASHLAFTSQSPLATRDQSSKV